MAIQIDGSNMPTFASQSVKQPPRAPQKYVRGSIVNVHRGNPTPPNTGFGENGYTGPSSLTDVKASDGLGDFDTTINDPVKDAIVSGKAADVSPQTRTVSAQPLKAANEGAKPGPKMPSGLTDNATDPVRKP